MAQTRLIRSVSAISDSQGRIVAGQNAFNLGPAEQGSVYKGTVQVPNAPAGGLFSATILGANWGQWAGPTNFGPIQMWGGETLQVTAVGLTPLTNYVLTFYGVEMPEEEAEPVPPAAPMSVVAVETTTLLVNGATPAGSPNQITGIRPPTLTRRITIVGDQNPAGGASNWALIGEQTATVYGTFDPSVHIPYFFAIEPAIDQTYKVVYQSGSGTSLHLWVLASFTNPLVVPEAPIPGTGSPVGTFSQSSRTGPTYNTSAQTVIAAQGAGRSIYIQTIVAANLGANGPVQMVFKRGGTGFCDLILPSTGSDSLVFPGGFQLGDNAALTVDTSLATTGSGMALDVTFVIGPTI